MNAAVKEQSTISFEEASRPLIKFYAAMLLEEEKNGNLDAFAEEIERREAEGIDTTGYTFREFLKEQEETNEVHDTTTGTTNDINTDHSKTILENV